MGANVEGEIEAANSPLSRDDPVTTLEIKSSQLHGTTVEPHEVPLAIDELPLVALLGAFAEGETIVRGAQELRVKETDRIETVVAGLRALGAQIEATDDGFVVTGRGSLHGGTISSRGDHRLAMLGAIAGLASTGGVEVDGMEAAARLLSDLHSRSGSPRNVIIAIDGPAGAGKSTVARAVAARLGFNYLDSGAMYRCVALASLEDPSHEPAELAAALTIRIGKRILIDGRDVTAAIRTAEVSARASEVAADPSCARRARTDPARAARDGRLGRRGPRYRHRGRSRRRAQDLPHRERRGPRGTPRQRADRLAGSP